MESFTTDQKFLSQVEAARMGKVEVQTEFYWGNLREWDHLEDAGVDGKKIIKRILEK